MPGETRLLTIQRRFFAALVEPIFADSRSRSELPPRDGNVSGAFVRTADELILPSALLEPVERLELYHRQYWYRLLDSLAEDFPGLRRLLGDEPFWRLIEAYVEATPSRSFTLRHLGGRLAEFTDAHPDVVPHPVHAADLARLEYALCETFEAAERPPLPPAELETGGVVLQPHLRLLALRTPADTLRRRVRSGRKPGALAPPAERPVRFVAVFRQDLKLRVERLPRAAFEILSALDHRGSLEGAMDEVTRRPGLLRAGDSERVARWFSEWVGRGWLCRPAVEPIRFLDERRAK